MVRIEPRRQAVGPQQFGGAQPLAARVAAELGEQFRACGAVAPLEFLDARGGDAYVLVLDQGGIDQLVQRGIAELFPPKEIGNFLLPLIFVTAVSIAQ